MRSESPVPRATPLLPVALTTMAAESLEAGPVRAAVTVVEPTEPDPMHPGRFRAATRMVVRADEPVFAGHYPGLPIFPGVCLLECALRSARLTPPPGMAEPILLEIEVARFVGVVVPGDAVSAELSWQRRGQGWRCSVQMTTDTGDVAGIRLRYAGGTP